jgi:hypothetical protein
MTLRRTATMKAALLGCALLAAFCLAFVSASSPPSLVDCRVASRIQHTLSVLPPEKRKPLLLFWDTEGVNHMMYGVWFGEDAYYQCPYSCEISDDRADYSRAEAVLFWATPTGKGVPFDQKCPKQLWIQSSTEAFDEVILDRTPPRGYRNGAPAIRAPLFGKDGKPLQMEGVVKDGWHIGVDEALMQDGRPSPIDHEVSWRRSLGEEKVTWLNNYDWNMDVVRAQPNAMGTGADAHRESARWIPEEILVDTKRRETRDKDQASVAAFISNCGAASPRLELLEELQKYIKVDSYGKCSHNRDVPDHWELEKDLSRGFLTQKNRILQRRYKFLLAFENSEIKDYVTEKFVSTQGDMS